jgi:phage FluMu protein Com
MNYFNTSEFLEPKCPSCKIVLNYGVNTTFSDKQNSQICSSCDTIL